VFPIAPRFYPIWLVQRLNSHVYKLKRGGCPKGKQI
jgi:hypothetical protein